MLAHEKYVMEQIEKGVNLETLLEYHNQQIAWMQHERLIHLLVTIATGILMIIIMGLFLFVDTIVTRGLLLVIFILFVMYLMHYFRLENTIQRWYNISNEIWSKIET